MKCKYTYVHKSTTYNCYCCREKKNEVPNQLVNFISKKQYLRATKLLVEAVNLGKGTLDGVESLKELSYELEQKKEVYILSF